MQTIYPGITRFPFEKTAAEIIETLGERDFSVPGIKVRMVSPPRWFGKYQVVQSVESDGFYFRYLPEIAIDSRVFNVSHLAQVNIPRKELHLYPNDSDIVFYLYAGNDWQKDQNRFKRGLKIDNCKRNRMEKWYLKYAGSHSEDRYASGEGLAPYLIPSTNNGQEYGPEGNEPRVIKTQDLLREIHEFLETKLQGIKSS